MCVGGLSVAVILLTPILAWFKFSIAASLDVSFWGCRYMFMLIYLVFNAGISIFPHTFNFLFFLTDGALLSQLTSLYLYNEMSMTCLLNLLPIFFVLHNHLLVVGIQGFTRDEQAQRLSFVRLIGRHDAVFLFVVYSLFTVLFTLVDTLSKDFRFGVNMWYLGYATYAFARLMEQKKAQGKGLWVVSLMSVAVFTVVYLLTLKNFSVNPHPERTFPLFKPPAPANQTLVGNETLSAFVNETVAAEVSSVVLPSQTSDL